MFFIPVPISGRLQFVVEPQTQLDLAAMRRASLGMELQRYAARLLFEIGRDAEIRAKSVVGTMGAKMRQPTPDSMLARKNPARRDVPAALYDEGKMRGGIRATVNRAMLTIQFGVRGEHSQLAAMHEQGYTYQITKASASVFMHKLAGNHDGMGGQSTRGFGGMFSRVGTFVSVPARPFLQPALEGAMDAALLRADNIAGSIFNIWLRRNASAAGLAAEAAMAAGAAEGGE